MPIFKEIKTKKIVPNHNQPRTFFDEAALEELTQSIQENGLLQPITVRETKDGYELIAGERRFRACQKLNMERIPAFIVKASDIESAQLALIENIQRENLSPIEEAKAYLQMLRLSNLTQAQLANKLGKKQSTIANKLRLLNLNGEVMNAIDNQTITERHGRALLNLDSEQQSKALSTIVTKGLNVAQTEEYVTKFNAPKKRKPKTKCFGVAPILIVNTIKEAFNKARALTDKVSLQQDEKEDCIIMTITIKK